MRRWWAWLACWALRIASLGYPLSFGAQDHTSLARVLIGVIALPVLLLSALAGFLFPETGHRPRTRAEP